MKIAVVFIGQLNDNGFNASALAGVEAELSVGQNEIEIVSGIPYDEKVMTEMLIKTTDRAEFIIFIGGQGDRVTVPVAAKYPGKRFAIIQGSGIGPNLFSYEVKQEESAFLAGVLAAELSKTRTIGHLSGHRVKPGLKGRAAYVAGARYVDPEIQILTSFCGTQDDNNVTKIWADAQIEHGADIIFTMLNGARSGAISACKARGVSQIGNAMDWCKVYPDIFIGSAIAKIDAAVRRAISDANQGKNPSSKVEIGLGEDGVVYLSLGDEIPTPIRKRLTDVESALKHKTIIIPRSYEGPEFEIAAAS